MSGWFVTVHWRCETCGCRKRTHMDNVGRIHQGARWYPESWVKHALAGNGRAETRLAFVKTLGPEFVARKNGRKKR